MTLLTSLTTSTNGLLAQTTALSDISGNLANATTTAYKTTDTSFADIVSALSSSASASTGASGVTASAQSNNTVQGTITSTSTATDMAINGSGYFAVTTATENTDGTLSFGSDTYYTRSGDFTVNAEGYLENSEGYYLLGYSEDPTTGAVSSALTPVQVDSSTTNAAVATSAIDYTADLPADATVGTTTAASTVTVYDSTGTSHDVTYSWTNTGTNQWTLNVTATDGAYDSSTGTSGDYTASIPVTFDSSGNVESIDTGDGYTVSGNAISFDLSYDGATTQTVSSDLSDVTQTGSGSTISVSSFTQNGFASGSYSSTSVDSSGNVSVTYSNGETLTYYEIPVATFRASDNLAAISGNAYQATSSSGAATYSTAGTSGTGTISSSSLESSDVDIATEFTDMISTQQIYSANAKVVTAVDQMMQTLTDLQ